MLLPGKLSPNELINESNFKSFHALVQLLLYKYTSHLLQSCWAGQDPGESWGLSHLHLEVPCSPSFPGTSLLESKGKGKRIPAALGTERSHSQSGGVREFRVCLWFPLPSSSSCFQRVGGISIRQHRPRVGLAGPAGTALCPAL